MHGTRWGNAGTWLLITTVNAIYTLIIVRATARKQWIYNCNTKRRSKHAHHVNLIKNSFLPLFRRVNNRQQIVLNQCNCLIDKNECKNRSGRAIWSVSDTILSFEERFLELSVGRNKHSTGYVQHTNLILSKRRAETWKHFFSRSAINLCDLSIRHVLMQIKRNIIMTWCLLCSKHWIVRLTVLSNSGNSANINNKIHTSNEEWLDRLRFTLKNVCFKRTEFATRKLSLLINAIKIQERCIVYYKTANG